MKASIACKTELSCITEDVLLTPWGKVGGLLDGLFRRMQDSLHQFMFAIGCRTASDYEQPQTHRAACSIQIPFKEEVEERIEEDLFEREDDRIKYRFGGIFASVENQPSDEEVNRQAAED
jgi:hypothetical protein